MGIPFKKVFNEATRAVQVFFYDPVGNAIELNQGNNTLNLFSLTQSETEETKVEELKQESQSEQDLVTQPELQAMEESKSQQELQMSDMANTIVEAKPDSGTLVQLQEVSEDTTLQPVEQSVDLQPTEIHTVQTQTETIDASSLIQDVGESSLPAEEPVIKIIELEPEALMNKPEVSYKCETKDEALESDAPKSMSNLQKIIFGSILLAVYLI